jgi:hypothetical protein
MNEAGSEFNTPRSENNTNFTSNAQQKAAIRGGQRGALQFLVSFPYSQRIQPSEGPPVVDEHEDGTGAAGTTLTSILLFEIMLCLGAVRGVCFIDQ